MPRDAAEKRKLWLAGSAAVIAVGVLGYLTITSVIGSGEDPASLSRQVTLMDVETGEVFRKYPLPEKATFPLANPKTGKRTLYVPEACYWGKDGKPKNEPTFVLLNELTKKSGPTICPECGRVVVLHNPAPMPSEYHKANDK